MSQCAEEINDVAEDAPQSSTSKDLYSSMSEDLWVYLLLLHWLVLWRFTLHNM